MICVSDEHRKALEVIRTEYYLYDSDEEIFEHFIEDYILRENGRLGEFKNGLYHE